MTYRDFLYTFMCLRLGMEMEPDEDYNGGDWPENPLAHSRHTTRQYKTVWISPTHIPYMNRIR